jgi:hypothetical protein
MRDRKPARLLVAIHMLLGCGSSVNSSPTSDAAVRFDGVVAPPIGDGLRFDGAIAPAMADDAGRDVTSSTCLEECGPVPTPLPTMKCNSPAIPVSGSGCFRDTSSMTCSWHPVKCGGDVPSCASDQCGEQPPFVKVECGQSGIQGRIYCLRIDGQCQWAPVCPPPL